jgi:DNA-directed RNA polymerase specialized sigma24 family protein
MLQPMHFVDERTTSYATVADFFKTFTDEMHSLNVLSLLLTADKDKAEECFVCAMGERVEGIAVFMEWAHLWARRAVIKYAIQIIRPVPEHPDSLPFISRKGQAPSAETNPFAAIVALGAFERFVFVMSVLEGQSEQECAILLRCSRRDVMVARVLALTRLANTDADYARAGGVMQA